jgi:EmrB/QacA subfamily drug resistance transporter
MKDAKLPDAGPDAMESGLRMTARKIRMLLCAAGASFMIMLDANIVAISLPSIARDLHGEFTDVEWVVSAYILPFAALLMPAGALCDRIGRRRILLIGLSIFTLASLFCGLATTLGMLNNARVLQAVGAALQLSAAMAVISHGFAPQQRVRVWAIWGTVMGLAPSFGPILGGLMTSYFGWRWAFFINIPIGLVLTLLGLNSIDESRDPKANRLDIFGIALFGAGLFNIIWALIDANSVGWGNVATVIKLAAGVMLLTAFVNAERSHPRPMFDLDLFRNRSAIGAAIAMFGYAATTQVMMTILPLYLQDAFDYIPSTAGLAMIPFALPLLIGPSAGGKLATRVSSRAILVFGLCLVATGEAIISLAVLGHASYAATGIGLLVTGCGAGLLNGETAKAQMSTVPQDRAGMASGIATTTRFVGINFGLAGLGAVLAATTEHNLSRLGAAQISGQNVDWHALSLMIVGGDAARAFAALPAGTKDAITPAIHRSVSSGFGVTFAVSMIVALVSAFLTWYFLPSEREKKASSPPMSAVANPVSRSDGL